MNTTDITIRPATSGEGVQIAELILLAWPVEDFLAKDPSLTYEGLRDMIAQAVEAPATIYSHENTFVGLVEGKIVGALCGYDGADYQRLKAPILDIIGHDSDFASLTETEAGEFYLDSVGVDPGFRGRGIASRLVAAQISRAKEGGHERVGLIVDIDKPEAEALYRRLGFVHKGYRMFFSHRMKHMVLDIRHTNP